MLAACGFWPGVIYQHVRRKKGTIKEKKYDTLGNSLDLFVSDAHAPKPETLEGAVDLSDAERSLINLHCTTVELQSDDERVRTGEGSCQRLAFRPLRHVFTQIYTSNL